MSEFVGFEEMMMVEGEDYENEYENEDTNTFQNENINDGENEYYQEDENINMLSLLEEKFQCNKCPKLFSQRDELFRHDATIHNDDKPFKCNLCGKAFGRKDYLTTHERIHLGIRPFKCSFCNKSFGRKHHLTVHEAIHTGNKKYQCMLCPKTFSQRHELTNHVCSQIEEKPFECPHCGSKFGVKNYLMKHIRRVHKNVKIPDSFGSYEYSTEMDSSTQDFSIGANISNESNLNFVKTEPYNQSTLDEKPFRCEHCGSKFALRTYMMRHMRRIHKIYQTRHPPQIAPSIDIKPNVVKIEDPLEEDELDVKEDLTGNDEFAIEKPWKCQLCTSEFTRKPYLMKHIKRMHIDRMGYNAVATPNMNNQNSSDIEQLEIEPDFPSIDDDSEDDPSNFVNAPSDFVDGPLAEDSIQENQIMFTSTPNRVDNGEKPWKCEYCISEFSRKSYMMKHMKRMHKILNNSAVDNIKDVVSFSTQESDVEQLEVEPDFPQIEIGNEPADDLQDNLEEEDINDIISVNDVEDDDVPNEIDIFPDTSAMLNLVWGSQDEARNNTSSSGNEAEKRFACSFCDRTFKRRDTLITHERIHTGEKPFKCQHCAKAFARKDYLTKHERQHVEGVVQISIKPPAPPASPKEALLPGEKPFKCNICPGSFTQKKNLARHLKHVHKFQRNSNVSILPTDNNISNGEIDIVDNDGQIDVNNIKQEIEDDNGNENYSQLHILDESNEKPHKCNYCAKRFRQRYLKETHERIHLGIKPFKCDLCSKQFTRKDHLNIHARLHSEDRQFSCSYCPKTFLQRKDVYIHEQTHTDQKPFKCKYCRSRFAVRSYMMKHMRRVHKNILAASTSGHSFNKTNTRISEDEQEIVNEPIIDDNDDDPTEEIEKTEITDELQENVDEGDDQELKDDKAYECEECDKSELFDITGLVRHILEIHTTTSKCQICVKSFYSKKELQRHLKAIHLDERPFTCRICFKCFSRPYFLRQHERTHSGIKPFGCLTCDKRFFTAALLADHERIHTGERPFNCQFCPESFRVKSDLTQHEKIHGVSKGFDCDQCHMSFSRNYNLIRHKKIHIRKLSCPI